MALDGFRRGVRVLIVSSVLVIALGLSGCIEVAMESEFNSDGSALHSMSTLVDRSLIDDEMLGGELDFDEIEQAGRDAGLEVERIDTSDRVGVRLSTEVDDNSDLGEAMNRLFNSTDAEGPDIDAFSGSFSESGGGFGGSTYRFELNIDGDRLFADQEMELDDEFGMGMDMMRQFINMTYTVSMPGEITEHNGTDMGDGRVQWDFPFSGSESFVVESEDGSGIPLALILGVGVGFLAVLLVVVGGVFLLRGRTAPAAPAPATAGVTATEAPYAPGPVGEPLAETEAPQAATPEDVDATDPEGRPRST